MVSKIMAKKKKLNKKHLKQVMNKSKSVQIDKQNKADQHRQEEIQQAFEIISNKITL